MSNEVDRLVETAVQLASDTSNQQFERGLPPYWAQQVLRNHIFLIGCCAALRRDVEQLKEMIEANLSGDHT